MACFLCLFVCFFCSNNIFTELNQFSVLKKEVKRAGIFPLKGILFPNCEILACLLINENIYDWKNGFKVSRVWITVAKAKLFITLFPDLGLPERIKEILHLPIISCTRCYIEILFVWKIKYGIQVAVVRGRDGSSSGGPGRLKIGNFCCKLQF